MWDALPPLIAIKTDKEESKVTFSACNVGLFDDHINNTEKTEKSTHEQLVSSSSSSPSSSSCIPSSLSPAHPHSLPLRAEEREVQQSSKQQLQLSYNFYHDNLEMSNLKRHFYFDDKQSWNATEENDNNNSETSKCTQIVNRQCEQAPSVFSPTVWEANKLFSSFAQESDNEWATQKKQHNNDEHNNNTSSSCCSSSSSSNNNNNNNNNNVIAALSTKWHLGKAKELLSYANSTWRNRPWINEHQLQKHEGQQEQECKTSQTKSVIERCSFEQRTSPSVDDVMDILYAYLDRVNTYTRYKNKCTDAYLTDIERAVDRYLVMYFSHHSVITITRQSLPSMTSAPSESNTRATLASPATVTEQVSKHWWQANNKQDINQDKCTITSKVNNSHSGDDENNDNNKPTPKDKYKTNMLMPSVDKEVEWPSVIQNVAKVSINKANETLKNVSSAWRKNYTSLQNEMCQRINTTNKNRDENEWIEKTPCNNSALLYNDHNCSSINTSNIREAESNRCIAKSLTFFYTSDVIPEHYTDAPPSTEAMERIRMNYPIILFVLNHTLPTLEHCTSSSSSLITTTTTTTKTATTTNNNQAVTKSETQSITKDAATITLASSKSETNNNATFEGDESRYKPIQRKWLHSCIAKELMAEHDKYDEHTRLRTNLFLPTIKNVWHAYLAPLRNKANELIQLARENVLSVMHEWKQTWHYQNTSTLQTERTQNNNNVNNITAKQIMQHSRRQSEGMSITKLSSELTLLMKQVDKAYHNLENDVEYIDKIECMDNAFVNNTDNHNNDNTTTAARTINSKEMQNEEWNGTDMNKLRQVYDTIHTMCDEIPVYGLILSRLHRLEMEHRTVLELWDHAEEYPYAQQEYS